MKAFTFQHPAAAEDAARAVAARSGAMFLAGGTTLVDLMKVEVLTPDTVVGVRRLGMSNIDVSDNAIVAGANVTNSQLAWHPVVRDRYPVLSEAILSAPRHSCATWRRLPATSCSGRAVRISEMFTRPATGDSQAPDAMRSRASIADRRCWARIHGSFRRANSSGEGAYICPQFTSN